jgi:hypothetical protein
MGDIIAFKEPVPGQKLESQRKKGNDNEVISCSKFELL